MLYIFIFLILYSSVCIYSKKEWENFIDRLDLLFVNDYFFIQCNQNELQVIRNLTTLEELITNMKCTNKNQIFAHGIDHIQMGEFFQYCTKCPHKNIVEFIGYFKRIKPFSKKKDKSFEWPFIYPLYKNDTKHNQPIKFDFHNEKQIKMTINKFNFNDLTYEKRDLVIYLDFINRPMVCFIAVKGLRKIKPNEPCDRNNIVDLVVKPVCLYKVGAKKTPTHEEVTNIFNTIFPYTKGQSYNYLYIPNINNFIHTNHLFNQINSTIKNNLLNKNNTFDHFNNHTQQSTSTHKNYEKKSKNNLKDKNKTFDDTLLSTEQNIQQIQTTQINDYTFDPSEINNISQTILPSKDYNILSTENNKLETISSIKHNDYYETSTTIDNNSSTNKYNSDEILSSEDEDSQNDSSIESDSSTESDESDESDESNESDESSSIIDQSDESSTIIYDNTDQIPITSTDNSEDMLQTKDIEFDQSSKSNENEFNVSSSSENNDLERIQIIKNEDNQNNTTIIDNDWMNVSLSEEDIIPLKSWPIKINKSKKSFQSINKISTKIPLIKYQKFKNNLQTKEMKSKNITLIKDHKSNKSLLTINDNSEILLSNSANEKKQKSLSKIPLIIFIGIIFISIIIGAIFFYKKKLKRQNDNEISNEQSNSSYESQLTESSNESNSIQSQNETSPTIQQQKFTIFNKQILSE